MVCLSDLEYGVLRQYIEGRVVENQEHLKLLRQMRSEPPYLIHMGVFPIKGKLQPTASLTEIGRETVWQEGIRRSPIRNLLYHALNYFS